MILNKHDYDKGIHPREGDYIIMGLVQNSQSKNNETPKDKTNIRKRFAFVSRSRKTTARDQEINLNLCKSSCRVCSLNVFSCQECSLNVFCS